MAALTLAAAALLLVLGPSTPAAVLLATVAAWLYQGPALATTALLFAAILALAVKERRDRQHRRAQRDGVREVLEALSESTRLEPDTAVAVRLGLARCTTPLAQAVSAELEGGAGVEEAFRASDVGELRSLATVLAHCRVVGARPNFAFTLLRDELQRRWQREEETETAVRLMRTVSTALAAAVLLLVAVVGLLSPYLFAPQERLVLALLLAGVAFAVTLPRLVSPQ